VNSSDIGINSTTDIANTITNAENNLTTARNNIDTASQDYANYLQNARTYVGYFHLGFICLIALIVLLVLCIILLYRNVKDACRKLGIVFFIYGALTFAVVVVAKKIATAQIAKANIQQGLSNIPGMALKDVTTPLQMVSLVCLIGGIVLILISFIYPRLKKTKTKQTTPAVS
jgi:hypothetical protein